MKGLDKQIDKILLEIGKVFYWEEYYNEHEEFCDDFRPKFKSLLSQAVQEALAKQKEEILAWVGEHLFYEDGGGVEGLDHNFVKTDDLETYLKGEK